MSNINRQHLYASAKIEVEYYSRTSNSPLRYRTGTAFVMVGAGDYPYIVTNRHLTDHYFNNKKPDYSASRGSIVLSGHWQPKETSAPTRPWKILIEDAQVYYHVDEKIDVAIIRLGPNSGRFVPTADGAEVVQTMNNFKSDWLATANEFEEILPGESLHIAGYPAVNDLSGDRPLIVTGIVASDPRYPAVFGTEAVPRSVLAHSFSWSGMSGSPVLSWPRGVGWGRIIGVNAGHFRASDVASGVISYFVRSDAILDILRTLGEPELAPGRDVSEISAS